jgi:phosphate:Na+ symporter
MDVHPLAALIGGLGLFLLGMARLTDGLKVAAGPSLRDLLNRWTSSAPRGLLAGVLITAIVQSSSAVTVATIGFVNAGLLSLTQAVWLIFGTNIGTTMTGWLVALIGVKLDMAALALPMIGLGMGLDLLGRRRVRVAGLGGALAGFGLFFLGVGILSSGFAGVADQLPVVSGDGPLVVALSLGLGMLLTLVTQSSSAAVVITLTATASGGLALLPAAAVVIGSNIGTTSTAGFAGIGATARARRVVLAHVAFNLVTGLLAIALLKPLVALALLLAGLIDPGSSPAPPALVLALFHTQFNLLGLLLMWPLSAALIRWLEQRFVSRETPERPLHLDPTLLAVPSLALRGLVLEIGALSVRAFALARNAMAQGAPPAEMAMERDAIITIGSSIRDFIARLASADLPADLASGMADLLRATQHVEDVAGLAAQLHPEHLPETLDGDLHALMDAACKGLAPLTPTPPDDTALQTVATELGTLEQSYQAAKTRLLAETVAGLMTPAAMEAALDQVQAVRRTGEAGLKARRRFLPWAAQAAGDHGQVQPAGRL